MKAIPLSDIIADVKRVASKLGTDTLSRSEYYQHGRYSHYQIYDDGHNWEEVCAKAGIKTRKKIEVSDEEYYVRLQKAFRLLGHYPNVSQRKRFGLNVNKSRYPTLKDLIKKAASLGYVPNLYPKEISEPKKVSLVVKDTKSMIPAIPESTKRAKWERIGVEGFPYAPHDELGVVGLFSILCSQKTIRWQILEMRGGKGIDITCYDDESDKMIRVELKHTLSKGSWNHRLDDLDVVVCWKNRWPDFPKEVLVLRDLLKK